jgi:hypothetical protein
MANPRILSQKIPIILTSKAFFWLKQGLADLQSRRCSGYAGFYFKKLPCVALKVHKNEIFFGFDFEFCTISMLVMFFFSGPLWGELRLFRVVLRLRGMKNFLR